MDANQRSETNNQTNNGANEKWTPGSKGNTTTGPNDHTYPQGAVQQAGLPGSGQQGVQRPGEGPAGTDADWFNRDDSRTPLNTGELHGGSMQSQQTGGSGPQQGITDSHQRQMEMHSEAWGKLEQPVGHRPADSGTDLLAHPANRQGNSQAVHEMNPQNAAQPELQGGSLGRHHGVPQGTTGPAAHGSQAGLPGSEQGELYGNRPAAMAGNAPGNRQSGTPDHLQSSGGRLDDVTPDGVQASGTQSTGIGSGKRQAGEMQSGGMQSGGMQSGAQGGGMQAAPQAGNMGTRDPSLNTQGDSTQTGAPAPAAGPWSHQGGNAQHAAGNVQHSTDREGSQTGPGAREAGTVDVHLSNDVAGGLPRSPGNSGPLNENPGWKPGGSMQRDEAVHQSNDTIGGLPRSPAGANKLAGDRKMDDDTGFSRK